MTQSRWWMVTATLALALAAGAVRGEEKPEVKSGSLLPRINFSIQVGRTEDRATCPKSDCAPSCTTSVPCAAPCKEKAGCGACTEKPGCGECPASSCGIVLTAGSKLPGINRLFKSMARCKDSSKECADCCEPTTHCCKSNRCGCCKDCSCKSCGANVNGPLFEDGCPVLLAAAPSPRTPCFVVVLSPAPSGLPVQPAPVCMPCAPAAPPTGIRVLHAPEATFGMPPMPTLVRCVAIEAAPKPSSAWIVRAACEGDKSQVEMQNSAGTCVTSDCLSIKTASGTCLKVCAESEQVQVCGACHDLEARADRVVCTGQDDRVVLEGHAILCYRHPDGKTCKVCADRITVNLTNGDLEIHVSGGKSSK